MTDQAKRVTALGYKRRIDSLRETAKKLADELYDYRQAFDIRWDMSKDPTDIADATDDLTHVTDLVSSVNDCVVNLIDATESLGKITETGWEKAREILKHKEGE